MVRWRYCLVVAMLLLLPTRTGSELEGLEEDERRTEDDENDDNQDNKEDEVQPAPERPASRVNVLRQGMPSTKPGPTKLTPLECFVCEYKAKTPLRTCLDPTEFGVDTMTCHSAEDRCFTTVVTRGSAFEAVVRGCCPSCVPTPDNTCCELNRCNNQTFAMPVQLSEASPLDSKTSKTIPPTVFFFVTILLLLQTVVKVSFV